MSGRITIRVGDRYGKLVVLSLDVAKTTKKQRVWSCRCDCGKDVSVRGGILTTKHTVSCGCKIHDKAILLEIGRRFERLVVVERIPNRHQTSWLCRCDCGAATIATSRTLVQGQKKSCGCLHDEGKKPRHGDSKRRLHLNWNNMIQRCRWPKHPRYYRYGGRGIYVCELWKTYENYRDWMIAHGYTDERVTGGRKLTLHRINNDGPYSPENCQLIPLAEHVSMHRRGAA